MCPSNRQIGTYWLVKVRQTLSPASLLIVNSSQEPCLFIDGGKQDFHLSQIWTEESYFCHRSAPLSVSVTLRIWWYLIPVNDTVIGLFCNFVLSYGYSCWVRGIRFYSDDMYALMLTSGQAWNMTFVMSTVFASCVRQVNGFLMCFLFITISLIE